jgi:hypothetical protein
LHFWLFFFFFFFFFVVVNHLSFILFATVTKYIRNLCQLSTTSCSCCVSSVFFLFVFRFFFLLLISVSLFYCIFCASVSSYQPFRPC